MEFWGIDIVFSATKELSERICNLVANNKIESSSSQMFEMKIEQYEIDHYDFSVSV